MQVIRSAGKLFSTGNNDQRRPTSSTANNTVYTVKAAGNKSFWDDDNDDYADDLGGPTMRVGDKIYRCAPRSVLSFTGTTDSGSPIVVSSILGRQTFSVQRCIARDVLGLYGCIITVATYSGPSPLSEEFPIDDIIKALKQCIIEHPVLSTVIQDSDTDNPQFARVTHMKLLQYIDIIHDIDSDLDLPQRLQHLLEKAHNEPWDDYNTRPPWRIYIVPLRQLPDSISVRYHLAFACSHALADGMSGATFHTTLLRALNRVEGLEYDSNPIWDIPLGAELPPPLEHAATLPISWSFLLPAAVNEFLPSWFTNAVGLRDTRADDAWCGALTRPKRPDLTKLLPTSVRTTVIPQATLQRVLNVCKNYNARLTGLLNHLTARALSRALRSRGQYYSRFIAETATDLRKCMSVAKNCMANYNSAVSETISMPENAEEVLNNEDWTAIRRSTELLHERSSTLADQPVALLKYVNSVRAWVSKQATKSANASFGMSNLGLVRDLSDADVLAGRRWLIEEVIFSQSADGVGPPLNVNVASVEGGPLVIVVTWWPGMLGVEDERRFVEEVCTSLVEQMEMIAQ